MISRLLHTVILIALAILCFAQTWPKIYGENIDTGPRKVIETYDSLCPGPIFSDTMTIDCDIWVDIDEMFEPETNSFLKVFPNPASDHIQIEIPSYRLSEETINGFNVTSAHKLEGDLIITIYDGYGKRVLEKEVPGSNKNIELDISAMNSGLHIVVLTLEGKVISSGKFIVNNK